MKLWNYLVIFVTIAIFFWIAGIDVVGITGILQTIGILDADGARNINSSNTLRTVILATLAAGAVVGITIGFFTKSKSENYVILPILTGTLLIVFMSFSYNIMSYAFTQGEWVGWITVMIFAPLGTGFLWSLIEFFRGTD